MSEGTAASRSESGGWINRVVILLLVIVIVGGFLYFRSQRKVVDLLQLSAMQNQRIEEYNRLGDQVRAFNSQFGAKFGKISTIENITQANSDIQEILDNPKAPSGVDSLMEDFQTTLDHVNYLGEKISKLENSIGHPHYVKSNENHANIALNYLTGEIGLPTDEAKRILKRTALIWELEPGNAVYNVYYDGVFLTTVTQGTAKSSPLVAQRRVREASSKRIAVLEEQLRQREALDTTRSDSLLKP